MLEKISRADRVRSKEVFRVVKEKGMVLHTIKEESLTAYVASCVEESFVNTILKGRYKEG
jgi:hypothetical protein